jgi:CVNH domain
MIRGSLTALFRHFAPFVLLGSVQIAQALPAGSYQQSCENSTVQGNTLISSCKSRSGSFHNTRLENFQQCVGDIFNDNGELNCSRGAPIPPGDYARSCEEIAVSGADLHANCFTKKHRLQATVLTNFRHCAGSISNIDGELTCKRDGPPPPAGGYTHSCRDSWVEGQTLHSKCKTITGAEVEATLNNIGRCRTPIANINGVLSCVEGSGPIPPGTYQQTCSNIVVSPNLLSAICRTITNDTRQSQIANPGACRSAVENRDGFLTCDMGNAAAPGGSYRESCHGIVTNGTVLSAECRRGDGAYIHSSIDFARCGGDISNNQGKLTCSGGNSAPPATLPATQNICATSRIPDGWITIDISSDPTRCPPATMNNIRTIKQYTSVPVGGTINVCSEAPTPTNWSTVATSTDPTKCGHTGTQVGNIKTIKRLQ